MTSTVFFLATLPLMAAAADLYVNLDPTSAPGYDPSAEQGSAANPFPTIQAAIDARSSGVAIHIANGRYALGGSALAFPTGSHDVTLDGESRAGVIVDGEALSRCLYIPESTYSFRINNMTFSNGWMTATSSSASTDLTGGGIYCGAITHLYVSNCTVTCCGVRTDEAKSIAGGGIYGCDADQWMYDSLVENCCVSNSTTGGSVNGGGLYCINCVRTTLRNCGIYHAKVSGYNNAQGGGARFGSYTDCRIEYCFGKNLSTDAGARGTIRGGGLHTGSTISNCVFVGNWVDGKGAAVGIFDAPYANVYNCSFLSNRCGIVAAGIVGWGRNVVNCYFEGNVSDTATVHEGQGAGVNMLDNGRVVNCVFKNNRSATSGTAIVGSTSGCLVSNCVFEGNIQRNPSTSDGGIVYWGNQRMNNIVDSCLFASNRIETTGGAVLTLFGMTNAVARNSLFRGNVSKNTIYIGVWDQWANPSAGDRYCYDPNNEEAFGVRLESLTLADNLITNSGYAVNHFNSPGIQLRNLLVYGNRTTAAAPSYASQIPSAYMTTSPAKTPPVPLVRYCAIDSRNENIAKFTDAAAQFNASVEDPHFADAAAGDYRPTRRSPFVDKGTNVAWAVAAPGTLSRKGPRDLGELTYDYDPSKPGVTVRRVKTVSRIRNGKMDPGCHEYKNPTGVIFSAR